MIDLYSLQQDKKLHKYLLEHVLVLWIIFPQDLGPMQTKAPSVLSKKCMFDLAFPNITYSSLCMCLIKINRQTKTLHCTYLYPWEGDEDMNTWQMLVMSLHEPLESTQVLQWRA